MGESKSGGKEVALEVAVDEESKGFSHASTRETGFLPSISLVNRNK